MQRFVWVVLALILSTLVQARDACAQQRIALVIGNGAYGKVPRLPKQDPYATALAAELVKPGRNDLLMFHNVGAPGHGNPHVTLQVYDGGRPV